MQNQSNFFVPDLNGLLILIVGGFAHDGHLQRIRSAFPQAEVEHYETKSNDASSRCFFAALQRPGVGLVVWLSGRTRTNHGRELRDLCRRLEIPWISFARMPHPNNLAAALHEPNTRKALGQRRAHVWVTEGGAA